MCEQNLCPICGEGHTSDQVKMVRYGYKNGGAELPLYYKQCDTCGSDFAGGEESVKNLRVVLDWRESVDKGENK